MIWIIALLCQCFNYGNADLKVESTRNVPLSDTLAYTVFHSYDELENALDEANADEVLVVNFWATWCAPCVKELPYFEELVQTKGEENLRVWLISLDFPNQIQKRFVPFIEKRKLTAELYVLDDPNENDWIDRVDSSWSGTIPATLFIQGEQRLFTEKEMHSVEEIKSYIKKLQK